MGFNELNSVENYIIKQLTGVNLNTGGVSEDPVQWLLAIQISTRIESLGKRSVVRV
jgi:hypothetical protein